MLLGLNNCSNKDLIPQVNNKQCRNLQQAKILKKTNNR